MCELSPTLTQYTITHDPINAAYTICNYTREGQRDGEGTARSSSQAASQSTTLRIIFC